MSSIGLKKVQTVDMEPLEFQLRELTRRLKNVSAIVANGGAIDLTLVDRLDEVSLRCDEQYATSKTIESADIELMNNLISLIELSADTPS